MSMTTHPRGCRLRRGLPGQPARPQLSQLAAPPPRLLGRRAPRRGGAATRWLAASAAVALAGMVAGMVAGAVAGAPAARAAGFGFTISGGFVTVDTGAGLVFRVRQSNGDMTSLRLNGRELQSQSRPAHVESGLGTAAVTASQSGNVIVVTESTNTFYGSGSLTHYFVARSGENTVYMATFVDAAGAGELRWIQPLDRTVLTNIPTASDIRGGTAIESTDIFTVNGQTRSKYYGNSRAIDLAVRGVTGNGVGVFMAFGNRESSSGGPFFRDIEQQGTQDTIEVYNYLWSGHNDPEAQRTGVLSGPYALLVTTGATPAAPDLSFMSGLGLRGTVPASGRGFVVGKAMGVSSGQPAVVGFANGQAQYWTRPGSDGNFSSPAMKAGSYTQTLYQNELPVATRPVAVTAGSTTNGQNITSTWSTPAATFRIGDWDGTPAGFKNAPNLTAMHPSDARQRSWGPTSFTVGGSIADFPAYQWKGVNNPTAVRFTLSAGQVANHTVRIGLTAAYAGGRPQLTINGWTSAAPAPSSQPSSRSLTIGTYRGNNALYTYPAPASAFVAGSNTMTITVISGSSGAGFLSPGLSYDAVELA
jgi:rhamnogalacturonan endolyase